MLDACLVPFNNWVIFLCRNSETEGFTVSDLKVQDAKVLKSDRCTSKLYKRITSHCLVTTVRD